MTEIIKGGIPKVESPKVEPPKVDKTKPSSISNPLDKYIPPLTEEDKSFHYLFVAEDDRLGASNSIQIHLNQGYEVHKMFGTRQAWMKIPNEIYEARVKAEQEFSESRIKRSDGGVKVEHKLTRGDLDELNG